MTRWLRPTVCAVLVAVMMLVPTGILLGGIAASPALRPPSVDAGLHVAATNFLSPYTTGMAASLVLGQSNFMTNAPAVTKTNLTGPNSVAVDESGDVWVVDFGASRVLEYTPPITVGEAASVVLGQPSFTSSAAGLGPANLSYPTAIAFDPHGDLWVTEFNDASILEFVPPFFTGMDASIILGQSTFGTTGAGTSATNLSGPNRLAFDPAGDLWMSDSYNNRVLEFQPPFTDGEAASVVIGQSTFSGSSGGLSATSFSFPIGIAVTSEWLWVGDAGNHRILGFPAPFTNAETATRVLGEPNFGDNTATGANATNDPVDLAVDASGDLWAADYNLNRVVEFAPPITTFPAPALVVGQSSLLGTFPGLTATNLSNPTGVALAPDGTLWVSDDSNNRLLGYVPPTFPLAFVQTGLPPGTPWSALVGGHAYPSTTGGISIPEINGTYAWSIGPAPAGYRLVSTAGGNVKVNGSAPSPVTVTFAAVTYVVAFTETGLPTGTNWSVTVGGTLFHATTTTISVVVSNGSYAYSTASTASGYTPFPASGTLLVSSGAPAVQVQFTQSSTSGSSTSLWEGLIIGLIVGLVIGALLVFLLGRRRSGAPATVAPWQETGTPTTPSASGGAAAPPPAYAPPPPPPGGGGPPPGAVG